MKFLTHKDILITLEEDNLLEIINNKLFLKDEAEERAVETTKEYLRQRYDVEHEFRAYSANGTNAEDRIIYDAGSNGLTEDIEIGVNSTSGLQPISDLLADDRNFSLKTIVLDLFKYELFQRVAPRALSDVVADRYDRAIDKLIKANKGVISMNLKILYVDDEVQDYRPFRHGNSSISENNKY